MFFRLNNSKPLTAIELTRVKAKSLEQFKELATHDLVELAVTDKGRAKYFHENLVMQAWGLCFAEDEDFSFETRIFRRIIEAAEVTREQSEMLSKCFDIIHAMYQSYDLSDKLDKKIAKKLTTRTHLVSLTKVIMAAVDKDVDVRLLAEWAKMFFNGGTKTSIDADYNTACGSGSARRDKIEARMNAIERHFARYVRIEHRSTVDDSHLESEESPASEEDSAPDEQPISEELTDTSDDEA